MVLRCSSLFYYVFLVSCFHLCSVASTFECCFRLSRCFEMLEIAPVCSGLFYVVFCDFECNLKWYSVVSGFSEVTEEISAQSGAALRLSATSPEKPHHQITLQSGFEWFELFGPVRVVPVVQVASICSSSFLVVSGCVKLFIGL